MLGSCVLLYVDHQMLTGELRRVTHVVVLGPVRVNVPPSMTNSSSWSSSITAQSMSALDNTKIVSSDRGRGRFCKSPHAALSQ